MTTLGLALSALLAAGAPPKIVTLQLEGAGAPAAAVESASLLVPTEIRRARPDAQVTSSEDVRALLTLQKNRAVLGACGPDAGCLGDVGGALGADEVVGGRLGLLGGTWVLELRRVDVRGSRNLASATRAVRSAEALVDAVRSAAAELYGASPAAPAGAPAAGEGDGTAGAVAPILPAVRSARPDDEALPRPRLAEDEELDFVPIRYRGTRHRAVYELVRRLLAEARVPVDVERLGDDGDLRLRSAWLAIERGRRLRFRVQVDGRVLLDVDREACRDTGCAETDTVSDGERKLATDLYALIRGPVEKGAF